MPSHSHTSSSTSGSANESGGCVPAPATIRLQRAMEAHGALQARTSQQLANKSHPTPVSNHEAKYSATDEAKASADLSMSPATIDQLATQLRTLWQREKNHQQEQINANDTPIEDSNSLPSLNAALLKIGSREKDELLLHLLEQQHTLRSQRSEVATLGEKIAAQLLQQQHELRQKYREQINKLEEQLHEALHSNPQVARLQAKVEELEESKRSHEQKLRFAVQKLQRSRKREKELKMMNEPWWD